jgi:pimeloyl-ACP methyl ester carboxylesterase
VLVDFRGHGRSGGREVGFGLVETDDLRDLRLALTQEGRVTGPCVAVGHSLGATVALRWQAVDAAVVATVAFGPYAEFVPAVERLRADYSPWVPRVWVRRAAGKVPVLGVELEVWDLACADGRCGALVASRATRRRPRTARNSGPDGRANS